MKKVLGSVLIFILLLSIASNCLAIKTFSPKNLKKDLGRDTSEIKQWGNWRLEYYLDNFKQPTKDGYITNYLNLYGTFSNSAATDEKLMIEWIVDKSSVAIKLYEYGNSLVKGYGTTNYSVTMRDSLGHDTALSASQKDGQDRIFFTSESSQKVRKALCEHEIVSFFMQDKRYNTNTYLFTVDDTKGFADAWKELTKSKSK